MVTVMRKPSRTQATPSDDHHQVVVPKQTRWGFRGMGCASAQNVSAPGQVIRSSADWGDKKVRKKKHLKIKKSNINTKKNHDGVNELTPMVTVIVAGSDICCAPGVGFGVRGDDALVDCVVARRSGMSGRDRDGERERERLSHRERSYVVRRAMDYPPSFDTLSSEMDASFGGRHRRHFRHRSPGGLEEIAMFQSCMMMGERSVGIDRYKDWRLNVDNMSYEELLELGDKIGIVSTGLKEDVILRCLRKSKHSIRDAFSPQFTTETDHKCSICQEEYEADDDMGKLDCGHNYHTYCIEQWLLQKNACPVCKIAVHS